MAKALNFNNGYNGQSMKVLQLLSSLQYDESERGIYAISHQLIKQGHSSMIVASAQNTHELAMRFVRDGSTYHRLPMPKKSWWSLKQVFKLRNLILTHRPDIIQVHSRTPAWILHWALRPIKKHPEKYHYFPKIIATVYGFYELNSYAKSLFDADVIVSASKSIDRYLKYELADDDEYLKKLTVINRGVDVRNYPYRYNPSVHWLQQIFAEFPELEHKKWLVFPTKISPESGQEWLIDILGNLANKHSDLHIIIMDDNDDDESTNNTNKDSLNQLAYNDFRQRITALNLHPQISFVGSRPSDLKDWLASAHIVLALANYPESIGMNVLKALHLGTPVLGWNKGAYADVLKTLYPRGLIKEQTAKALCRAVSSQLDCKVRPSITYEYELPTMVEQTIELYEYLYKNTGTDGSFLSTPLPP